MGFFIPIGIRRQKEIAVPDGLHHYKGAIQHQAHHSYKNKLGRRVLRAGCSGGIIWQDQGEHQDGSKCNQCGTYARQAKYLFLEPCAAHQQAQANNSG
ncbi:hypothetical protein D3C87_1303770 [compost metagenome]